MIPLYIQSMFPAILLLAGSIMAVSSPAMPLFRPVEEKKAFEYLAQTANKQDVVLAQFNTSNAVPAWAPVRVITGHGPESIHFDEIQPRVDAFYQTGMGASHLSLLREFNIKYVFYGPEESGEGPSAFVDAQVLNLIYSSYRYRIYQVNAEALK